MRVAGLLAIALLLSGCAVGGTKTITTTRTKTVTVTQTVTTETSPATGPLAETSHAQYFGVPVSITKVDAKRYLLVLQPKYFLVGVTANVASAAARGITCAPLACPSPENDYWAISGGTTNLTFILPATTKGTLLLGGDVNGTPATATQFAAIVSGTSKPQLMDPLESGVWLSVNSDTVTSFAQQFVP